MPNIQASRAWWPEPASEAIRLGLTVVAALYLAMEFELERPEWAAWTVLSVSLASRASSLEKAAWRVVGTLIGAAASLAITAAFAQDTLAFDVALALWLGLATLLASTARRQDSYGFALIGFTVPIITLSNVSQPQSVFPTAVDRCSALLLGIACAYASAALVASGVGTVRIRLADKMEAATRACAEWWQACSKRGCHKPRRQRPTCCSRGIGRASAGVCGALSPPAGCCGDNAASAGEEPWRRRSRSTAIGEWPPTTPCARWPAGGSLPSR